MKDRNVLIHGGVTDGTEPSTFPGQIQQVAIDSDGCVRVAIQASSGLPLAGVANNTDLVTPSALTRNLPVASYGYGFDSTNNFWRRVGARASNAMNVISPSASDFLLATWSIPVNWDGTFLRRNYAASAANLALQSGEGVQLETGPGEWAINHAPAANTTATISRAAVAGQRHVCKGLDVSINAVAAIAAPLVVNLRDGATGAGTILWTERLMAPAGTTVRIARDGLNIVGSENTAMTLEFTAAPGATNFENVNLNGYTAA